MKKQSKASSRNVRMPKTSPSAGAGTHERSYTRRSLLGLVRNGVIAAVVLSASGWAVAGYIQGQAELHDLSVIGNGIPTVVQIHDPQCPTCLRLQKDMLRAAGHFTDYELQVRVANIRTTEGREMADRHGVGHVTLLLFDGNGRMARVLPGANASDVLRSAFEAHIAGAPSSREKASATN